MSQNKIIKKYQALVDSEGDTLARLLILASREISFLTLENFNKANQLQLTLSEFHLLQMLCLKGMTGTELAKRLDVSKQSIGQTVDELVAKGLVKKTQSSTDSRAKIISHSNKGFKVASLILDSSIEQEDLIAKKVGKKRFLETKKVLTELLTK